MPSVFAALVAVMVLVAIARNSIRQRRVEFNAFFFFSLGFLYYWFLPLLFAAYADGLDVEELSIASDIASHIGEDSLSFYGAMCVGCFAAFWFGYSRISKGTPRATYPAFVAPQHGLGGLVVIATLVAAAMAIPVREHLFRGYHEELFADYAEGVVADALPRGAFVAAVSMLFVLCFMWAAQAASRSTRPRDFLLSTPMKVYYLFQLLVLSMGGRLYFVSNVLSVLAFLTLRYRVAVRPAMLLATAALAIVLVGAIGALRDGEGVSWTRIVTNIAQEPGLTAVSLFSFLEDGNFPALRFPTFLLGDLVNLLPSSIFPQKLAWLSRPQDYGFVINMPLGGLHSFVSLIVNFGWAGTILACGGIGAAVAALYNRTSTWLGTVVYCMVSGWLGFSLFRDPMSVSVVKNILQVSVLWPILVAWGLSRLARVRMPAPRVTPVR